MAYYLNTQHQRKSALLTLLVMSGLILLLFLVGMRYMDPPEEYGVAINFGTSDIGSGPPKVQETIKSAPTPIEEVQEQPQETPSEPVEEVVEEEVLTQKTAEAPVLPPKKKEPKKEVVEPKKKKEDSKPTPKKKEAPKPSEATKNALANLLNGAKSDGETATGEGDDNKAGLKGSKLGDPNSSKYYGNGGSGGDGNYSLSGRAPLTKPRINPNCNEEGKVVVRIEVDKNGKVIKAVPGIKGTENTAPCLMQAAKKAAMQTTWNADNEAPSKQIGKIIYHFSLSE